jgi:hypothetical protein
MQMTMAGAIHALIIIFTMVSATDRLAGELNTWALVLLSVLFWCGAACISLWLPSAQKAVAFTGCNLGLASAQ